MQDLFRTKWAAIGAAVAITLGAGGVSLTQAALTDGDKPVYVSLDEPCRLVDTRPDSQIGPKNTPIAAGDTESYEIQVTGANGNCTGALAIPTDAVGVSTNVTAIQPSGAASGRSYFTIYPADATRPVTSNLNFLNGQPPTPNKVDVGLSASGKIIIYNNDGTAHAAVDIFGYYIDHRHDDRYYTETEVDTALATKAAVPDLVVVDALQFGHLGDGWTVQPYWLDRDSTPGASCAGADVDLPAGSMVESITLVYDSFAGTPDVRLRRVARGAGPYDDEFLVQGAQSVPAVGEFTIGRADIPVDDPGPIVAGSSYIASVCSSAAFIVRAIEIGLS